MSTTMGGSSVEKAAVFEMWLRQFPAFRLHQRRERRGIVEHQLADQLGGALTHAENNRRSRRASSSAMVSALIMPRSALIRCKKNAYLWGSAPVVD
jgi:hypothetical protein